MSWSDLDLTFDLAIVTLTYINHVQAISRKVYGVGIFGRHIG